MGVEMVINTTFRCVQEWSIGAVFAAAAAALVGIGPAHADTPDDVLGQAVSDLSQGTAVLDAAPSADLSTSQIDFLTNQETAITDFEPFLAQLGTQQEGLSSVDQAFLVGADEHIVSAAQNLLTADQALVVADQAGQLTGSLDSFDFGIVNADIGLVSADFAAIGDTLIAGLFPDLGTLLP